MRILGISAFYHDSAACLIQDGQVVAAAQEERFTRRRHDSAFPRQAVEFCLKQGGLRPEDLDAVAFYDKPLLKFDRILETHLAWAPRGLKSFMMAVPVWLAEKLWMPSVISKEVGNGLPLLFAEHHESHAASAFFPSHRYTCTSASSSSSSNTSTTRTRSSTPARSLAPSATSSTSPTRTGSFHASTTSHWWHDARSLAP